MSAMPSIASLIGHSGSSAFRQTTTTAVSMSLTGSCFSSESAPGPSIMGVEDEAEQSTERPCVTNGRSKRLGELTSSIVPRGTSFHRRVELEFPPIGCDPAGFSRCYGLFPGPSELGAVNPNAVQDHGQAACQSHDRLF